MVVGFSKKKIQSNKKTLGEIFRSRRIGKKISLESAETETKIRHSYLEAIEKSDWSPLPSEVYVRSFVVAYAKYLKLDLDKILAKYWAESASRTGDKQVHISYDQKINERKVMITPKILAYSGLCLFIVSMAAYIIYQLIGFAGSPNLEISSPANNSIVETETVTVNGVTDNDTFVVVNDENVPVTQDGRFQALLKLQRGLNVIEVVAVNKAKKETSQVYTVEFKPKTAAVDIVNNQ